MHEVTHDILTWQTELGYAEDAAKFDPTLRKKFEWQANQGAAELLFQGDLFADMAADYTIGMATVLELAHKFGASGHAAFVRYVETHHATVAGIVLDLSPCDRHPLRYRRREVVYSQKWESRFGGIEYWPYTLSTMPYSFITSVSAAHKTGTAVAGAVDLPDRRNETVTLATEVYSNTYKNFALIWLPRREVFRRHRIITPRHAAADNLTAHA